VPSSFFCLAQGAAASNTNPFAAVPTQELDIPSRDVGTHDECTEAESDKDGTCFLSASHLYSKRRASRVLGVELSESTAREPSERAWVTLLVGSSANSTAAVEMQILSVQRFSSYPHITMVTPDVNDESLARLREMGSVVVPVGHVGVPWAPPSYWCTCST